MNGQVFFRREGDWLVGVAEFARAGRAPQRIEARANMRQIAQWLVPMMCRGCEGQIAAAAGGDPAAVGFFGKLIKKIGRGIKKVAKGKVFRSIAKAAKGAVKYARKGLKAFTKVPGMEAAMMAAAAAFPPMGVPALAAFKGANMALAAAEKGGAAAKQLETGIRKLTRVSKGRGPAALKARKALKVLKVTNRWRRGLHAAQRQATRQAVAGLELPPSMIPLDFRGC
jgi:hypothetical protein